MSLTRRVFLVAAIAATPFVSSLPAYAGDAVVDASLWDNPDMDVATGLGYAMGGDMTLASMGIKVSAAEVSAGSITFNVTNDSKDFEHEMVVARLHDGMALPYDAEIERVIEDDTDNLGEVSELQPGKSGTVTLDMTPGEYILYCNIAGHYTAGMWTVLTVK